MLWAIITLILLVAAVITIVITAVLFASEWAKGKDKKATHAQEYDNASRAFRESEQYSKVPDSAITVMCLDGASVKGLISGVNHSCWRADNHVHFYPHPPLSVNYMAYPKNTTLGCAIPIHSILRFKREGVVTYENPNAAGAEGRNMPNQTVVAHDTRHARLTIKEPNGDETAILFSELAYYAFQHIIPEKEYKPIVETAKKPTIDDLLVSMEQTAVFDDTALRREGKTRRRRADQADQPAMY